MGKINNRLVISVVAFAVVLTAAAVAYKRCFSELSLLAKETVAVYSSAETALRASQKDKIGEIAINQRVKVIRCVDVKHYYIYEIELPNGSEGFVNYGSYVFLRNGAASHC